jgi:hypothetical protein
MGRACQEDKFAMLLWLKRLLARVVGRGWTRTRRRTDWRGRPAGDNTQEANVPVRFARQDWSATLDPYSLAPESSTNDATDP